MNSFFRQRWPAALLVPCVALGLSLSPQAPAQSARKPMLMEGKKTLYQRVLTRPGATLAACEPVLGCKGDPAKALPPFEVFYVYDRVERDGAPVMLVGRNERGALSGYLPVDAAVEWKHAMVLSFEERSGRNRALFFDERKPMLEFLERKTLGDDLKAAYAAVDQDKTPANAAIIAAEPLEHVDLREQFYLLPVLQADTTRIKVGGKTKKKVTAVEVASIIAGKSASGTDPAKPPPPKTSSRGNEELKNFSAAIVFVIDASSSMQAEIDNARDAIMRIYRKVESEGLADKVRFGLVGYQDDPQATEGMDYLSRVFVDPGKVKSSDSFLAAAKSLAATPNSTRAWAEDGYAGIMAAVEGMDWAPFGGKYLVFISDASSRGATADGRTPASATGLNAKGVNGLALEKRIAIYTLHILTAGAKERGDIDKGKGQYQTLGTYPGVNSLYTGVKSAREDAAAYSAAVESLASVLVQQVRGSSKGELIEDPLQDPKVKPGKLTLEQKAQAVGRAMQLAYLGRQRETEAPEMLRAWTIDKSPDRPGTTALKVRVLLNKDQLSDMRDSVSSIYNEGIATEFQPEEFLPKLTAVAATMGRSPDKGDDGYSRSLEDTQLLGEYLEGLPYESPAMKLTEQKWMDRGASGQEEFLNDLKSKLELYRRIHDDIDNWVILDPDGEPGDAVYPVPLSILP